MLSNLGLILWGVVFVVVLICSIIYTAVKVDWPEWYHFCIVCPVVSGFITYFIGVFVWIACLGLALSKPDPTSRQEITIYSIGTDTRFEVNGKFFLGCGTLHGESEPSYRFYAKQNGGLVLREVPAKNFVVILTDDVKPKVVINATRRVTYPNFLNFLWSEPEYWPIELKDQSGKIYIPKNSIVQSYNMNL